MRFEQQEGVGLTESLVGSIRLQRRYVGLREQVGSPEGSYYCNPDKFWWKRVVAIGVGGRLDFLKGP